MFKLIKTTTTKIAKDTHNNSKKQEKKLKGTNRENW